MTLARDSCVVATAPLASLVHEFIADWNRERPSPGGHGARAELTRGTPAPVGAIEWLAAESGVSRAMIENLARDPLRTRTTEMRTADALVAALGRPELFHDGTLEPVPNPIAPRAVRAQCCGGLSR